MMDSTKYGIGYFAPPAEKGHHYDWTQRDHIEQAPIWCSVDLRDGNQSLMVPMDLEQKLEFFELLVRIGFKEIEVAFPAASDTEFEFVRRLIEEDRIPDDVTIQVMTQCREHIIRRTFEAIEGAPRAIVNFYNSTSAVQREQVFRKSRQEILEIATDSARLIKELGSRHRGSLRYEYIPESFTGTEPEYALEVCNAVIDILEPVSERPMVITLPATVELSMPHIYANQVEYMSKNLHRRDSVILSAHPHNDRGCGVADAELALLAGAQRIECCLFGNGERTGNADAITLALNMYSQGVDPGLDLSDIPGICEEYERLTGMHIYERTPYAGSLVFAAFSGGHQDAIAKSLDYRAEHGLHRWSCPYIPIDPEDIGRTYDTDVIRLNSQSGKGGIRFLLHRRFGYYPPSRMCQELGAKVKSLSDHDHKELSVDELLELYESSYVNHTSPLNVTGAHFIQNDDGSITADIMLDHEGRSMSGRAAGNGRLDAVATAIEQRMGLSFVLTHYSEHALDSDTDSRACSYVGLRWSDGTETWGCGTHTDIIMAGIRALVSAINNK